MDDFNEIMSDLQRKMMRFLLRHFNGLNATIRELDDDIDNFMKPKEKRVAEMM